MDIRHSQIDDTRQLQFWNAATKVYEPSAHQGSLDPGDARIAACGRAWRIAKAERPLKPRYVGPHYTASIYSARQVQSRYMAWAVTQGLRKVTQFAERPVSDRCGFYGEIATVRAADYFTVTAEHEAENSGHEWQIAA